MNISMIRYILCQVMRIEGALMLLPSLISIIYGDGEGMLYRNRSFMACHECVWMSSFLAFGGDPVIYGCFLRDRFGFYYDRCEHP